VNVSSQAKARGTIFGKPAKLLAFFLNLPSEAKKRIF
jgi:hypothetical protein